MTHPDAYRTIKRSSSGDYREKGSKFLSELFECSSIDDLKHEIARLKKEHPTARHFCTGVVIGTDAETAEYRSNDDGEPSGTAGLPILHQLQSAELMNAAIVVIRYFGGTKLGKPGLIHAYKESARLAIESAKPIVKYRRTRLNIRFNYDSTGAVMSAIDRIAHAEIIEQTFDQDCSLIIALPNSEVDQALHLFDHTDDVHIKEISE